jgi:seryl-tRNA synthetase
MIRFELKTVANTLNDIISMEKSNEISTERLKIRIKRLRSDLEYKQGQLNSVDAQLKEAIAENKKLRKQLDQPNVPKDGYEHNRTWISKIVFMLTNANKPLRSVEIIALLLQREPVLNEKVSKEKFISPFLNSAMQYERLIPFKLKGVRGNYYCLPEWMDEENQLMPEMRKKIY